MIKVLLLENPHPVGAELLRSAGMDVQVRSGSLDESELIAALEGVHVLGIRSKTEVTKRVLAHSPSLQSIGAFCIGTNQVATHFAAERGIPVFNAPYSNTRSVVELAIGEIIALTRRMTVKNSKLHRGVWDKSADNAHELRGRTLGIVGYGNIGSQLSVLAEALGMNVLFYDIEERLDLGNARRVASLDDLLSTSDVVSLHVNGLESNRGLIGAEEIAKMKPGSVLVNLSRGFVVDVEALRAALESGHLKGAAVDVFPEEPKQNGDSFASVLQGMDNVILTPHIGGSTIEAQQSIGAFVAGKLVDYTDLGNTSMAVNTPGLTLPRTPNAAGRLTFMHHNIPGVMARLNDALASHRVNVESQALATSGSIGYAVTDVGSPLPQQAIDQVEQSDASISVRYLPF